MTYSKWAGWTTCSKLDDFFFSFFFFNCCERWKGALRLTCWQGRGSFESSHRPCLSSLTAGARWWPSRSPCWAQSSSRHCLHTPPRWALSRDPRLSLAVISSRLKPRSTLTLRQPMDRLHHSLTNSRVPWSALLAQQQDAGCISASRALGDL